AGGRCHQSEESRDLRDRQREQRAVHVQGAGVFREASQRDGGTVMGSEFRVQGSGFSCWFSVLVLVLVLGSRFSVLAEAQAPEKSCDGFLLAPRQVRGKAVGPKSCLMQETATTYEGRSLTRIDVGLDGTVDGFLAKVGNYKEYFSNSPDLVFPQTWGEREIF